MEKLIQVLLKLSVVLSMTVAVLLIVGGVMLFLQPGGGTFFLSRLLGVILCLLGAGVLFSMIFSCILPRK